MDKVKHIIQYKKGEYYTIQGKNVKMVMGETCKECALHSKQNDFCFQSHCISWIREGNGKGKDIIFIEV